MCLCLCVCARVCYGITLCAFFYGPRFFFCVFAKRVEGVVSVTSACMQCLHPNGRAWASVSAVCVLCVCVCPLRKILTICLRESSSFPVPVFAKLENNEIP